MYKRYSLFLLLSVLLILTACGKKSNDETSKTPETNTSSVMEIKNAWMQPGSLNRNSALFCEIVNNTDKQDTLYEVDSDMAKLVQIHESYKAEGDMMGMRQVDSVIVPAKSTVMFNPGGYHVMLIGLNSDMKIGSKGNAVFKFKNAGEVKVTGEVKAGE